MSLRNYFAGQSICLRSLLSPRTVAERINATAGSSFWPFTTGVVGGVRSSRVRLRYRSSFQEYNAKPVLSGRLREGPAGSLLTLRYRAPFGAHLFDVVWYGGLALLALSFVFGFGEVSPDLTWGDWALIGAGYVAFLVGPIALHYFGTRNADTELTYLLDFLAEHADATPVPPKAF